MGYKDEFMLNRTAQLSQLLDSNFKGSNYIDLNWSALLSGKEGIRFIPSEHPREATIFVSKGGTVHFYGNNPIVAAGFLK